MREYETVFITQPNLPDSQQKQLLERVGSLIERHEGRLFYARNMGRRTLAYPIAKQTKGIYTCLDYASKGSAVGELERNLRLDENVLRFLTTVKAEEVDVEARAAEIVARGEDVEPALPEEGAPAAAPASDGATGGEAATETKSVEANAPAKEGE